VDKHRQERQIVAPRPHAGQRPHKHSLCPRLRRFRFEKIEENFLLKQVLPKTVRTKKKRVAGLYRAALRLSRLREAAGHIAHYAQQGGAVFVKINFLPADLSGQIFFVGYGEVPGDLEQKAAGEIVPPGPGGPGRPGRR